jgi:hypothetical protein
VHTLAHNHTPSHPLTHLVCLTRTSLLLPCAVAQTVDKAIFIKDVEAYKSMRFESARRKIAKLLYQRFVSQDGDFEKFPKGSSVFTLIRQERQAEAEEKALPPMGATPGQPGTPADGKSATAGTTPPLGTPGGAVAPGGMAVGSGQVAPGTSPPGTAPGTTPGTTPGGVPMTRLSTGERQKSAADKEKDILNGSGAPNAPGGPVVGGPTGAVAGAAVGPDGKADPNANTLQAAANAGSPTGPGRASRTAITMNVTSSMVGAGVGLHHHGEETKKSDSKDEKTVISSTGPHTQTHLHSLKNDSVISHGGPGNPAAAAAASILQIGNTNNAIGVYGKIVKRVKERVLKARPSPRSSIRCGNGVAAV